MIKRVTAILFIFGGTILSLFANEDDDIKNIYNSFLPNFQQLSPEVSALGNFSNYRASGNTGVPEISIPLFNLTSGSFVLPVELAYDASGIKVEQDATYVGLGWNLIMGGTITQIVCGQNDFFERSDRLINNVDLLREVWPERNSISSPHADHCIISYPLVIHNFTFKVMPVEEDITKNDILQSVSKGLEIPDIFHASFCGHSVSFVIDKNKMHGNNVKIIGCDATNYTIELDDNMGACPNVIVITDDHGRKYVFTPAPSNSMYDNASYILSEIKDASGKELVEFKYSLNECTIFKSYYETEGKNDESYNRPLGSRIIETQFIDRNYPTTLTRLLKTYCPDTILTDREIVTFTYSEREDINNSKKIDQILIKSRSDNSLIHTVGFLYDNFIEESCDIELSNRYRYSDFYNGKRLKLTEVTVDGKTFSFRYNEDRNLPSRLSVSQDFWGYYNGQNNSQGFCASPEYKFNDKGELFGIEAVGSANRYASETYSVIGVLNRITYPTGGYTDFIYESNHFDDIYGKYYYPSATSSLNVTKESFVSCGSGYTGTGYKSTPDSLTFDISQSTKVDIVSRTPYLPSPQQYYRLHFRLEGKDSIGGTVYVKYWDKYNDKEDFRETATLPMGHYVLSSNFEYVTSGLMIGGNIKVSFPPEYEADGSIADASGKSIGGGLRIRRIESYDEDNNPLGYTAYKYEGGKLLIPTVKKEMIPMMYLYAQMNSDIYSKVYAYDCRFFFITSHPTYPAICSFGSPHVGYTKIIKEKYNNKGQLMSYDTEKFNNDGYHVYDTGEDNYYNLFSVNFNGQNGKLIESATFSADSITMSKKNYLYTTFGDYPSQEDVVLFPWARCLDMGHTNSAINVFYKYSLYPKYPITVLPGIMNETLYSNGTPMQSIVTFYSYKESNFQPTTITKFYPTNTITTTKYWYPDDSSVSSSNTQCLLSAHCISEKVKAIELYNGKTVGGYRNYYDVSYNLPVVRQNFSIAADGSERSELYVTKYDEYGNICEYIKNDGVPVTLIWSYNHQCPILEVIGEYYDSVKNMSSLVSVLENMVEVPASMITTLHSCLAQNGLKATAYEYSPWLTVSRIIRPNGYAVDYSYDCYGRLIRKNNTDGIIQKFEYNYKH